MPLVLEAAVFNSKWISPPFSKKPPIFITFDNLIDSPL